MHLLHHNHLTVLSHTTRIVLSPRVEKLAFEKSLAFHLTYCVFYKQSVIPFDDANTKTFLSKYLL